MFSRSSITKTINIRVTMMVIVIIMMMMVRKAEKVMLHELGWRNALRYVERGWYIQLGQNTEHHWRLQQTRCSLCVEDLFL